MQQAINYVYFFTKQFPFYPLDKRFSEIFCSHLLAHKRSAQMPVRYCSRGASGAAMVPFMEVEIQRIVSH
jgi:hypothetical protein